MRMLKQRAARQGISQELDIQKHVLRQMHARRLEGMQPGEYRATMDPENPVLIQGNWQQPTTEERLKNDAVYNLQDRLDVIKVRQTVTSSRAMRPQVDARRELYQQPDMVSSAALKWTFCAHTRIAASFSASGVRQNEYERKLHEDVARAGLLVP